MTDTTRELELLIVKLKICSAKLKNGEANQLFHAKQYKEALAIYSEIINDISPYINFLSHTDDFVIFYNNRCSCYMMLSQYEDALRDAKKCLELDYTNIQTLRHLIKCSLMVGDVLGTESAVGKLEQLEPLKHSIRTELFDLDNLKKYLLEADIAFSLKNYQMALYYMDYCCEISPYSTKFKIIKAEYLILLRRYIEAETYANKVLYVDKKNVDAMYVKGVSLYYQDNVDQAFKNFEQVLCLNPHHIKTFDTYQQAKLLQSIKKLGDAAFRAQEYQTADYFYTKALLLDPLSTTINSKIHYNKAVIAIKVMHIAETLFKLVDSINECNKALELNNNYLKAILIRAACYMKLEEFNLAFRDCEKAYKLDRSKDSERLLNKAKTALKKTIFDNFQFHSSKENENSRKERYQKDSWSNSQEENDKKQKKNYYVILDISITASIEDIKKAYYKKAKIYHPDRHPNASVNEKRELEKKFKEVGEAYSVLCDLEKRSCYDKGQKVSNSTRDFTEEKENNSNSSSHSNSCHQSSYSGQSKYRYYGENQSKSQFDSNEESYDKYKSRYKENDCWYHSAFGDRCWKCWPEKCEKPFSYTKMEIIMDFELID